MSILLLIAKVFGYAAAGAFLLWLIGVIFKLEKLKLMIESWFNWK